MVITTLPKALFRDVPPDRLIHEAGLTSCELLPGDTSVLDVQRYGASVPPGVRLGQSVFADIRAYKTDDAIVRGADTIVRDGQIVFVDGAHPGYLAAYFPAWAETLGASASDLLHVAEPVVSIGHWNAATYGHFLLEVLPKIFVFQKVRETYPNARLLVSSYLGEGLTALLRAFVDEDALLRFDHERQMVAAERLIVVDSLAAADAIHPAMQGFVDLAQGKAPRTSSDKRRIFLSKASWREDRFDYRILENEAEIAAQLRAIDIETIYPEQLPWLDQVALFSQAELIVGEYSSALHNALFSPPGTRVIALNWVNAVQETIAAFADHRLGFVLPSDGRPRLWEPDVPQQRYAVDAGEVLSLARDMSSL